MKFQFKKAIRLFTYIFWGLTLGIPEVAQGQEHPNILFIAVDDLNCDFGAYGNRVVKSPTLDQIAAEGILFTNNHCQKAVCGASRASVMSGFTPEHTGITGFRQYLRDMYPDVVTIPLFFKNNGYTTVGMGKIHDPRNVSLTDEVDLISWTRWVDVSGNRYAETSAKPVTEAADVNDNGYIDGNIADAGVAEIKKLAGGEDPFFLAVGFKKPHLPFACPKKYWDLYDRDSISLAAYRKFAVNDVDFVHNPGDEFRNGYDNVPQEGDFPYDLQREYIHGYYACVSYIDTQIEKLINELKANGAYDNTIIVIWGDHGFSLGDHTNWGKHTNFEYATRSPMIIRSPGGREGFVNSSPSELLDIYPTLVDLAGFQVPDTLDGNSLKPIVDGAADRVKSFAISQFRRGGSQGFALRSDYYQYVEWDDGGGISHQQLFNFAADPYQTRNLYLDKPYDQIIDTFSFRLNRYLTEGENSEALVITSDTDSLGLYRVEHQLEFSIYGQNGMEYLPLKDAYIDLQPFGLPTSGAGYAALHLPPKTYRYTITSEKYDTIAGTVDLTKDTLIRDTLSRLSYINTILVTDRYTGYALYDIEVHLGDQTAKTNLSGKAEFVVKPGTYSLSITADGYKDYNSEITVLEDAQVPVMLSPATADLEFQVLSYGVPLNEVTIIFSDTVDTLTNLLGRVLFEDLPAEENYSYLAMKEGYETLSGNVFLLADTTVELGMLPSTYDVTFTVTEQEGGAALPGALVTLGSNSAISGGNGSVIFTDITYGSYDYSIEIDGYENQTGSLALGSDTLIGVQMVLISSTKISEGEYSRVYPNPASEAIFFECGPGIATLVLMDGRGRIIRQVDKNDKRNISLSGLAPGIYFVMVKNIHGEKVSINKFVKK